MAESGQQGLQAKSTLTDEEITAIRALKEQCEAYDHAPIRIPLDILHKRTGTEINDFLYYDEQGQLIGYLYVDNWGKSGREVTGMVAPASRRQGIFRQLFTATAAVCKAREMSYLTLVCEHGSHAGQAFVKSVRTRHDASQGEDFSEHFMVLGLFIDRQKTDPQFEMHRAEQADKETVVTILSTDMAPDDARQMVDEIYADANQRVYVATLAGQPLGSLRLDERSDEIGIYGFVVLPAHRGHGYGRQMLEYIIRKLKTEGASRIVLEVETDNHRALALYTHCGFEIKATYDYYNHDL
jgi:ribosomal protein S18 acetylase RimI-like enzyme